MEYATEMLIKAKKANLNIIEVPINFYKDKRNKKSHLNPIKDGIKHIKVLINNIFLWENLIKVEKCWKVYWYFSAFLLLLKQ